MQVADNHINSLSHAIQICMDRNIHFAAYQLPEKTEVTLVLQKEPEIREFGNINQEFPDKGFLIAPFSRNTGDKTILISPDIVIHEPVSPEQIEELLSLPSFKINPTKTPFPEKQEKRNMAD